MVSTVRRCIDLLVRLRTEGPSNLTGLLILSGRTGHKVGVLNRKNDNFSLADQELPLPQEQDKACPGIPVFERRPITLLLLIGGRARGGT